MCLLHYLSFFRNFFFSSSSINVVLCVAWRRLTISLARVSMCLCMCVFVYSIFVVFCVVCVHIFTVMYIIKRVEVYFPPQSDELAYVTQVLTSVGLRDAVCAGE